MQIPQQKLYSDLATWWPLVSAPEDYQEEVEFFLPLFAPITANPPVTLLELGSGGGNNALYMKSAFAAVTLTDLSEQMLAVSRKLNPECEHIQGDMRTIRLNQTFDAVFIHDAIDYMLTLADLRQALETAFIHCKPGGMAIIVPDAMRETFETSTDHGGDDSEDGTQGVRLLEWTYDPDPNDTTYTTDYVVVIRDGNAPVQVIHDQHIGGLFSLEDWQRLLREVGFSADYVIDPFERYVFVAHKS